MPQLGREGSKLRRCFNGGGGGTLEQREKGYKYLTLPN
jgi:hypothetical protein